MKKKYPCLFCLSFSRSFKSEEHVLPRGLGNTLKVLPPGVVCDKCNNGVLAGLDEVLTNFDPIKFQRIMNGITNREGKVQPSKHNNLDITQIGPNHLGVVMKSKKASYFQPTETGFNLTVVGGHKITNSYMKKVLRALYKMGLEMVYSDLGARTAYAKRFDGIRKIVLGQQDFSGSVAFVKHPEIIRKAEAKHHTYIMGGKKVSFFNFNYYGVQMLYGMEKRNARESDKIPSGVLDIISVHKGK